MTKSVSIRLAVLLVALVASVLLAASARADVGAPAVASVPVTGTTSDGGTFAGTMDVTGFAVQDGQVVALGTMSGTLTDSSGNTVGTVSDAPVAAAVQQAAA